MIPLPLTNHLVPSSESFCTAWYGFPTAGASDLIYRTRITWGTYKWSLESGASAIDTKSQNKFIKQKNKRMQKVKQTKSKKCVFVAFVHLFFSALCSLCFAFVSLITKASIS